MQMEPLKGTAVGRGSARLCSKTILLAQCPRKTKARSNTNKRQSTYHKFLAPWYGVTIMHWQKMPTLEKNCDASFNLFLKDTLAACLPLHIFKIDFLLVYVLL